MTRVQFPDAEFQSIAYVFQHAMNFHCGGDFCFDSTRHLSELYVNIMCHKFRMAMAPDHKFRHRDSNPGLVGESHAS